MNGLYKNSRTISFAALEGKFRAWSMQNDQNNPKKHDPSRFVTPIHIDAEFQPKYD